MKQNIASYFIAFFFVCIYLFKGGASLVSTLLPAEKNDFLFALLMDTEKEDEKNKTEEKLDAETKELYLHPGSLLYLNLPSTIINEANNFSLATPHIQQVYASIATPPPELA